MKCKNGDQACGQEPCVCMTERQKLDRIIELHEEHRADLIQIAQLVADSIEQLNGRVTSPEVVSKMRALGMGEVLDNVDRRFLGAVFRRPGWERVGFENKGSHARPVAIWKRKGA